MVAVSCVSMMWYPQNSMYACMVFMQNGTHMQLCAVTPPSSLTAAQSECDIPKAAGSVCAKQMGGTSSMKGFVLGLHESPLLKDNAKQSTMHAYTCMHACGVCLMQVRPLILHGLLTR
jgi:hypothetical protein